MADLELEHEELQISLISNERDDGDVLILQQIKKYVVPIEFRKYLQVLADLDATTLESQIFEFYFDSERHSDQDMAVDHTELFVGANDLTKHYVAGRVLQHAFEKIDLIDFFDGVHMGGMESREDIERELVKVRELLTPEEHEHLNAAIEAALRLDGKALAHHVHELRHAAERWPENEVTEPPPYWKRDRRNPSTGDPE